MKYSVLLLCHDAGDPAAQTYYGFTDAESPREAVRKVKRQARRAWGSGYAFQVELILKGHREGLAQ